MEKIKLNLIAIILATAGIFASCELDNYEAPTAELSGSFIDYETQELVQQDIIRGTVIRITEHGYDPVANQYLNAKPDGTYMDKFIFANTYSVQPERGNFVSVEEQEIVIEGKTKLDFIVTPYIRINDVSIVKSGSKIIATFKLQQNVDNNIKTIGLYGHPNPIAGQPIRTVASEMAINAVVDPNQTFTLEIDIAANNALEEGNQYFFRVGALIDVPEAKFNYAPAVRLSI
jgi:hypothetical protein